MADINPKLLDHFLNPRNVGTLDHPDGHGQAYNPVNHYLTELDLRITDDTIIDAKFKSFGCVVTIAAASASTLAVKGKKVTDILNTPDPIKTLENSILHELDTIPEENWHCLPTAVQVILTALLDNATKQHNQQRQRQITTLLNTLQASVIQRLALPNTK